MVYGKKLEIFFEGFDFDSIDGCCSLFWRELSLELSIRTTLIFRKIQFFWNFLILLSISYCLNYVFNQLQKWFWYKVGVLNIFIIFDSLFFVVQLLFTKEIVFNDNMLVQKFELQKHNKINISQNHLQY